MYAKNDGRKVESIAGSTINMTDADDGTIHLANDVYYKNEMRKLILFLDGSGRLFSATYEDEVVHLGSTVRTEYIGREQVYSRICIGQNLKKNL